MVYRYSGGGGVSPSPKRVGTGIPPPSPPITTTTTEVAERDAKTLERMLQQMDEAFHSDDENIERQLRLQLLEERQMALRRLCEAALDQEEDQNDILNYPVPISDCARNRRVEMGIVSTPRSLEGYPPYDDAAAVARSIRRSASRNGAVFVLPLQPRPTTASLPESSSDVETVEDRGSLRRPPPPPPTVPTTTTTTGVDSGRCYRGLPPPLFEDAGLAEERSLVEAFLAGPRHPYAAEEDLPPRPPLWSAPTRRPASGRAAPSNSPENFDRYEDEQILKSVLAQLNGNKREEMKDSRTAITSSPPHPPPPSYKNETLDATAPMVEITEGTSGNLSSNVLPNHNMQQQPNQLGTAPREVDTMVDDVLSTGTGEIQELLKENQSLHRELEAQDGVLRELTYKTESLARHLVKSMRERTQLQQRLERLEELLRNANSEIGRLKQATESQREVACGAAGWRAALHAKERELLICEDELRRLRGIVENRILRSEKVQKQQDNTMVLTQVHGDLEELIQELGISHMRRREAEEHARQISEELEAAQSHIQLLDKRLSDAERAAAAQRLREIQECLVPDDDISQLSPSSLLLSPSLPIPSAEDVSSWPFSARRELARLASHAEGLLFQHAESDRHAELRLSNARREVDELREKCCAYEEEVKTLESENDMLRRERVARKVSERRWMQQLIDIRDDSVMVSDLLHNTKNKAEEVLRLVASLDSIHREVKMEVEPFVNNVVRDWDTIMRFLTVLQHINFEDSQQQEREKEEKNLERISLSAATKARKDFVLRAVEIAMARDGCSVTAVKKEQQQQQQQQQQECNPNRSALAEWPVMRNISPGKRTIDVRRDVSDVGKLQLNTVKRAPLLPPTPVSPSRPLFFQDEIGSANMATNDIQNNERQNSKQEKKEGMGLLHPPSPHIPPPLSPPPAPPFPSPPSSAFLPNAAAVAVAAVVEEVSRKSIPREDNKKKMPLNPQKEQSLSRVPPVSESEESIGSTYKKSPSPIHRRTLPGVVAEISDNECISSNVTPPAPVLRGHTKSPHSSVGENPRKADSVSLEGEKESTINVLPQPQQKEKELQQQQKAPFSVSPIQSGSREEIEDVVELIDSESKKKTDLVEKSRLTAKDELVKNDTSHKTRTEIQKQQGSNSDSLKKDTGNSVVTRITNKSRSSSSNNSESGTKANAVNSSMKTSTPSSASDVNKNKIRFQYRIKGAQSFSTDDNDNEPSLRMFTPRNKSIPKEQESLEKNVSNEKEENVQKSVINSDNQIVSSDLTSKITTSVMDTSPSLKPSTISSSGSVLPRSITQHSGGASALTGSSRSSLRKPSSSQVSEELPPKPPSMTTSQPIRGAPAVSTPASALAVGKKDNTTLSNTPNLGNVNSEITSRRRPSASMEFPSLHRPRVGHTKQQAQSEETVARTGSAVKTPETK
ncbi:hypothetical protein LSM04_001384 [Trypanosoma melophagium]|uniref:uncharacterized protein n=1 Tax=Trypanosoma melophagium TaxID=715481 RepID=UPI00351A8B1B|nr:hypothetical protein LSM04_001384 [Trypanosoma melophagium]